MQTGAWTDASRTSSALADAGEEVHPLASPNTGHQPALSVAFQHNFIEAGLPRLALPPPLHRAAATSAVKVVTDFRSGSRRCDRVQDGLGDGHGRDGAANEPSGACCQRAPNQRAPASLPPRASRGNEPVPSPRVPYDVTVECAGLGLVTLSPPQQATQLTCCFFQGIATGVLYTPTATAPLVEWMRRRRWCHKSTDFVLPKQPVLSIFANLSQWGSFNPEKFFG